jgi:hypothetical protein
LAAGSAEGVAGIPVQESTGLSVDGGWREERVRAGSISFARMAKEGGVAVEGRQLPFVCSTYPHQQRGQSRFELDGMRGPSLPWLRQHCWLAAQWYLSE